MAAAGARSGRTAARGGGEDLTIGGAFHRMFCMPSLRRMRCIPPPATRICLRLSERAIARARLCSLQLGIDRFETHQGLNLLRVSAAADAAAADAAAESAHALGRLACGSAFERPR